MINAFAAIQAAGEVEATTVAAGIKVALITTATGLAIAIITYNRGWFDRTGWAVVVVLVGLAALAAGLAHGSYGDSRQAHAQAGRSNPSVLP